MISTSNIPSNFANAVSPYTPMGSRPVGEENPEARTSPFKPVEKLPETARNQTRRRDENVSQNTQAEPEDSKSAKASDADAQVSEQQQSVERREIAQLAARDKEVRAHEQAHRSAGGSLTGSASYQYERGPDGVSYAVSGEVPIRLGSGSDDPKEALAVARKVQQAALAPAEPSTQDRQAAAQAAQMEQEALQAILSLAQEEASARKAENADRSEVDSEEQSAVQEDKKDDQQSEEVRIEDQTYTEPGIPLIDLNERLIAIGITDRPAVGSLIDRSA